ncbi:MAG: hypothetical protein CMJ64_06045 [Planctomycetaceae bacterium]|nr:hypothetical protein [Planctomycetaceae bacterium]
MVTLEVFALALALSAPNDAVLLEFSAPWCGPCRSMQPTVERLAREGYTVQQIDVGQRADLAKQYRITGLPTFVMIVEGREVDRVVGPSDYQRLRQLFPQRSVAESRVGATVRAQSPDGSQPSQAVASNLDPRALAVRATVRIRVDDPQGQSIGTGTIVDAYQHEALVLTCGHIFRESHGRGQLHVDLFDGVTARTVPATLISYDLDRDIGLVSLVPGKAVKPVRIATAGYRFHTGDDVFSVGCDHGERPSLRESRITSIDRYLGPPNIEAAGEPTVGRSGGGLFSREGSLIGVCNHADPRDDEGIYASLPTIHWELDRVGQRRIYAGSTDSLAVAAPGLRAPAMDRQLVPVNKSQPSPTAGSPNTGTDAEVICIVRSRTNPQAGERVYVLDQPSRDFLDRIARESRSGLAARTAQTPGANLPSLPPGGPVVRAQSSDRK